MIPRALFICKQSENDDNYSYGYFRQFSGLFNSARFISDMLEESGFFSEVETAHDNNDIDKLVTKHKPDFVFIEALWVVPEKFDVLQKLHPDVTWIVRIHSELPFIAMESIAVDWCVRYLTENDNIIIAPNSIRMAEDLRTIVDSYGVDTSRIVYLPNYYPLDKTKAYHKPEPLDLDINGNKIINIGCFGSIRPFKNQLSQAVAAIKFADGIDAKLKFHINGNRVEQGASNLQNIKKLFEHHAKHELVEHSWQSHVGFIQLLRTMDIGMQVSFTESFNIVAADMVSIGIPVVTSPEIDWVHPFFYANPNSTSDIAATLDKVWYFRYFQLQRINRRRLKAYDKTSKLLWNIFLLECIDSTTNYIGLD